MEAKLGPDGVPDSVSVPDVGLHTADLEVIGVGVVRDLFAENMGTTVTNKAIVAALRSALPGLRTRRYNSIGRRGIESLQGDASPGARFVNQIGRRASGWVLEPKYTTDEMGTSEWSGTPREKRHVIGAPPQPPVLKSLVSRPGPEQSTFSLRSTGRAPMPSGTQRQRKTPANPHDSHEATLQAVQTALKILQKTHRQITTAQLYRQVVGTNSSVAPRLFWAGLTKHACGKDGLWVLSEIPRSDGQIVRAFQRKIPNG